MFTLEHLIWIGLCIAVITIASIFSCRRKFSFQKASVIMAVISLLSESSKICSEMIFVNGRDASQGMVINAQALPFHLCSLMIFVFFYLPFSKNEAFKQRLINFFVPIGLLGAPLAILIPTNGTDFLTVQAYQCFVYHSAMLWFAVYLLMTRQVNLDMHELGKNIITLFVLAVVMIWVNGALHTYDTNFFYIVRPPMEGLPFLNLDHGWYVYLMRLIILAVSGISAVHLVYCFHKKKK